MKIKKKRDKKESDGYRIGSITYLLLRECFLGQKGRRADQCNCVVLKVKENSIYLVRCRSSCVDEPDTYVYYKNRVRLK